VSAYYLDTSALVKRYIAETGTTWLSAITTPSARHDIYIARIAGAELIAALFRRVRMGEINRPDALQLAADFKTDWQTQYQIVEITVNLIDRAMALAEQHNLRGYDAVQLAAALELQSVRNTLTLPPLVFIAADNALNTIAQIEGLQVDDPNDHI
jgi:predicted nucleic acid-binding protein